jgi:hypothetical protein
MTKLICHSLYGELLPEFRPAPRPRQWMDETPKGYANRCLPLSIANQHGWQILNLGAFTAMWDGQADNAAVRIVPDDGEGLMAQSVLGSGVLSFIIPCLFRTESGLNLWVSGPINEFKPGLQALTAIVETDWLQFYFMMNWRFTRAHEVVRFEKGDPICQIFPISRSLIESVEPVFRKLSDDPDLDRQFWAANDSRGEFICEMRIEGTPAHKAGWQKHYMRGVTLDGERFADHQTRLALREFRWEADAEAGDAPA